MSKPSYLTELEYLREQVEWLYDEVEQDYLKHYETETLGNILKASELLEETIEEIREINEERRVESRRENWEDCWHSYK